MGPISAGQPAACTTMIAAVRSVSTASSVSAVRSEVSGSMSANTGVAPTATTQLAVAMKLRAGTTTSSPGPMPKPRSASSSARVPFATATAWARPSFSAYSRSSARPSVPVQ